MDSADIKTEEQDLGINGLDTSLPASTALEEPQIAPSSFTPINTFFHPPGAVQTIARAFPPPAAVMTQGDGNNDDSLFVPLTNESAEPTNPTYHMTQQGPLDHGQPSHDAAPLNPAKRARSDQGALASKKNNKKKPKAKWVEKYDDHVESETSRFAVDQPCFKVAQDLILKVVDPVINKIDELATEGYSDEVTRAISRRLKDKRYKRDVPIGKISGTLLGETGSGKSSVGGSLLNNAHAAVQGHGATRGTSTITEFAGPEIGQSENFRGMVIPLTYSRIESLVKEFVQDCLDWHAQKDDDQDLDSTALDGLTSKYDTAVWFSNLLLRDSADFATEEATKAFFFNAYFTGVNPVDVTDHLRTRVSAYSSISRKDHGAIIVSGNTMSEVNEKLKTYRGPVSAGSNAPIAASPWPLVGKILISMKARLLSTGFVLCDPPGTADTNGFVVKMTTDYIQSSKLNIIVGPSKRIEVNETFWDNVRRSYKAGMQHDSVLVITHSDLLKHGENQNRFSASEQDAIARLRSCVDTIDEKIGELQGDLEDCDEDDKMACYMIKEKVETKELEKMAADVKCKEAETLFDNAHTTTALQRKYELVTGVKDVRVFCVSNLIYQDDYLNGHDPKKQPKLSLEATDIPALRQHILGIPARLKRETLLQLCLGDLPSLLRGLEMQCLKSRHEQKKSLEEYFNKPGSELNRIMLNAKEQLQGRLEGILHSVTLGQETKWLSAARRHHKASSEKYKLPTYGAICRRFGQYRIAKKGAQTQTIDWNATLAQISEDDLLNVFDEIRANMHDFGSSLLGDILGTLLRLEKNLNGCPELIGHDEDIARFIKDIQTARANISRAARDLFFELDAAMNVIRYNSTDLEAEGSYFTSNMATTYEACNDRKKAGKHGGPGATYHDMKTIMSMKLCGPDNIFRDVINAAQDASWEAVNRWHANALNTIGYHLKVIVNNFNNRFDNDEPEDEVKRASRQKLLVTLRESMGISETELVPMAKEVESYE
ncbi:hypothetical protein LTS10_010643 [Elasticomyces elasticus]|nr:hypothetical protein LTS10_010643 [Elasticomyces elasticus]